jgi:hypothetical protein
MGISIEVPFSLIRPPCTAALVRSTWAISRGVCVFVLIFPAQVNWSSSDGKDDAKIHAEVKAPVRLAGKCRYPFLAVANAASFAA